MQMTSGHETEAILTNIVESQENESCYNTR